MSFNAGACAREGCRKNDRASESQRVSRMGLGRINVDPLESGEGRGVKPRTVSEENVTAKISHGRFQMQAAGDRHSHDFIMMRREDGSQLANAFGIGAASEPNEQLAADAQDIATLQRAGKRDIFELAKRRQRLGERGGFRAASFRSERQDDSQFIENDGRIFDKHGIRKIGLSGKRNDAGSEFGEKVFIGMVLLLGDRQADRAAVDKRKFAMNDSGTDGAGDGGEHDGRESLHENEEPYTTVEGKREAE